MSNIIIKTAFDHIRRAPFQALAAVMVLTITFFVATILSILVYSSSQVLKYFETRPQIIAFLKDEAKPEDISSLQNKLLNDFRIRDARYVSKEQALEIYKKATSENPLLSELVSPSIFPASVEFTLTDLSFAQSVIEDVKKSEIVDQVGFTASIEGEKGLQNAVERLRTITSYVRLGGAAFVIFLFGTSFFVLLIIIGMRMVSRRSEIEILDLIGATPGFIRNPIILEAIIYGILGVLAGWILALILVLYITPSLISYFGEIPAVPKDTNYLLLIFGVVLVAELIVGVFLALTGSLIAVSRARRKK